MTNYTGDPVKIQWWEWYTLKPPNYPDELVPFQWHDIYANEELREKGTAFNNFNFDADTTAPKLNTMMEYFLSDPPSMSIKEHKAYVQYALWGIRIESDPKCNCPPPQYHTAYAYQGILIQNRDQKYNKFMRNWPQAPGQKLQLYNYTDKNAYVIDHQQLYVHNNGMISSGIKPDGPLLKVPPYPPFKTWSK